MSTLVLSHRVTGTYSSRVPLYVADEWWISLLDEWDATYILIGFFFLIVFVFISLIFFFCLLQLSLTSGFQLIYITLKYYIFKLSMYVLISYIYLSYIC